MKNFFWVTAIFVVGLATTSKVQAQFTFGVRTGFNRIELKWDSHYFSWNDMKIGFQIGAVANYAVSDRFSVEYEIIFIKVSALKSEYLQVDHLTGEEIERVFIKNPDNYVQLPIRARYKVGNNLILQAGIYFGFEFGGNCEVATTVNGTKHVTTYTPKKYFEQHKRRPDDEYKVFDWGLGVGIARQFRHNIQVGLDISRRINSPKQAHLLPAKLGNLSLTATYMF